MVLKFAVLLNYSLRSLRHTNITLQIAAGIPMTTVSHRAGHTRTSTTTDIYAHLLTSSDEHAVNVLDELVTNPTEPVKGASNKLQIDNTQKILDEMEELGITSITDYMNYLKNNVC